MRPRMRDSYNSNGERNFTYLCTLKDKSRKQLCQCKNISGIETDRLVVSKLKEMTMPNSEFMKKLHEIADGRDKQASRKETELKNLNMNYARNKSKIEILIDRLADVDKDVINEVANQIKELKTKNNEMEKRIEELKVEVENQVDQKKTAGIALNLIETYMNKFDELDLVTKRSLIRLLVCSVESDGENVYIKYIGDSNASTSP